MKYWARLITMIIFDAVLVILSVYLSLLLRFEGGIGAHYSQVFIDLVPWFVVVSLASFYFLKIYHRMWQYASVSELYGIIKAVTTSMLIMAALTYAALLPQLPRSVYIFSWILMIVLIGSSRLGWRILRDFLTRDRAFEPQKALIIGAGDGGALVARELKNNQGLNLQAVGFIDDSRSKRNLSLYDIPVLGNRKAIPRIVRNKGIEVIIIAIPSAGGKVIKEILEICQSTEAQVRIFQGGGSFLSQDNKIRKIEVEDLLRRAPVKLDMKEIADVLDGKTVLVSGAGGSIGSELCRQICAFKPGSLILLDCSENNLFDIDNELREAYPDIHTEAELADIKDRARLQTLFSRSRPAVVFHAAAYKHVPMMEKHPAEAVKNNILGTRNMAEMADRFGAETFILISTDKAVNPTSVMGATKRIAEMLIQDLNQNSRTQFAAVRFGNVLGSRGSVIPTFKKQIENGGPVTVTHPDMIRYFMTIPEAVQLVIEAGAMARGGEIFVLDMGEPVKILDLAQDLIRLYGYEPNKDIKITFSGIRPGEKLYEELFSAREQLAATMHDRIYVYNNGRKKYFSSIDTIDTLFSLNSFINRSDIVELISSVLPEYHAAGKNNIEPESVIKKAESFCVTKGGSIHNT